MKARLVATRLARPLTSLASDGREWARTHTPEVASFGVLALLLLPVFALWARALNYVDYESLGDRGQGLTVFLSSLYVLCALSLVVRLGSTVKRWGRAGYPILGLRRWREQCTLERKLQKIAKENAASAEQSAEVRSMREQYLTLGEKLAETRGLNPLRATLQAHAALDELLKPLEKSKA